ncbi:MotE family protein [Undibacter mobilis]|uniref:Flagellar protein FlbB n=1 Tax=Undibacter mobilis TaxID=2292256 RepID=A0A371BCA6_9BRAD|nr:flagellar protein FlbB [Undibacter mobilis]RDV05198.1 flagellar protein FlbB [Undibacter mobilis]
MIKLAREFRLIPIVLLATICLLGLKVTGLVFDGGYTLGERLAERGKPAGMTVTSSKDLPDYPRIVVAGEPSPPETPAANAASPWAKEMFNFGGGSARAPEVVGSVANRTAVLPKIGAAAGDNEIVTGSAGGGTPQHSAAQPPAEPLKATDKPPAPTKLEVGGDAQPLSPGKINSPAERAILGRLQDRRETLDNRNKELDMRESLIKAAEKRLEAKVGEMKDIETRIKTATDAREKEEKERLKGLVAMYENMKPKDAARIFDRLDLRVLVDLSTAMKPITMSAVLAQMSPEAAERLTVELASRANAPKAQSAGDLPKIEGQPGKM